MSFCQRLIVSLIALAGWAGSPGQAAPPPSCKLKLISINCSRVRAGAVFDGLDSRGLSASQEQGIVAQVVQSGADIAVFQGLWRNKSRIADQLKKQYKYSLAANRAETAPGFMVHQAVPEDGLLILSKWVPCFSRFREFKKKYGPDEGLKKGVLLGLFYHPSGGFITILDTQLQSGFDDEACSVREKQVTDMAYWYRELRNSDWRLLTSRNIVVGDFHEPITYDRASGRIFDRTGYLLYRMQGWKLNVSNNQTLDRLFKNPALKELVQPDQQREKGPIRRGGLGQPVVAHLDPEDPRLGPFKGGQAGGWAYWPEATDATGCQILDQIYLDPGTCTLNSLQVLRAAFLGDRGPDRPYDAARALTERAAILAEITVSAYQ